MGYSVIVLQMDAAGVDEPFDQEQWRGDGGEPPPEFDAGLAAGGDGDADAAGGGVGGDQVGLVGVEEVDGHLVETGDGDVEGVEADQVEGGEDEVAGGGDLDGLGAAGAVQADLGAVAGDALDVAERDGGGGAGGEGFADVHLGAEGEVLEGLVHEDG